MITPQTTLPYISGFLLIIITKSDIRLKSKLQAKENPQTVRANYTITIYGFLVVPALTFPANWETVYSARKDEKIAARIAMVLTETKRTSFYKLVQMTGNTIK